MESFARINQEAYGWLRCFPLEMGVVSRWGETCLDDEPNFCEGFNKVLKETSNINITMCVHMTFYRVNDYFVLRRKTTATHLAVEGLYLP